MGKMKGNRLNTAANLGTFVTSRQALKVQRQMAADLSVLAEAQRRQLAAEDQTRQAQLAEAQRKANEAERQELFRWAVAEVEAGRMSAAEAKASVERTWFNRTHSAPPPYTRITPSFATGMQTVMDRAPLPGWYKEGDGNARYWDGREWTLQRLSVTEARQEVRDEWIGQSPEAGARSGKAAGWLGIFLGWLGVHRFYLGYSILGVVQLIVGLILIVPTFGLIVIWGAVEGLLFLLGRNPAYQRDVRGVPLRY
jgi:TM2 domain-containing membrane protein YozV